MIFEATLAGRALRLEVRSRNGAHTVLASGREVQVEVSEQGPFLTLRVDGRIHEVGITARGAFFDVALPGALIAVALRDVTRGGLAGAVKASAGPARVTAPMPGKVTRVLVSRGQAVEAGTGLVVIEAMKMENELRAPRAGEVLELPAREGQAVESGALLAVVG